MRRLIFLIFCLILSNCLYAENDIFVDMEKVNLKLDELLYSGAADVEQFPGGFVILLDRSHQNNLLVTVDKKGNILATYDKTGNGPGEIRDLKNIAVTDNSILSCEMQTPFIHELSHDLKFKNDYRIKGAGKLYILGTKYFGIWRPSNFDEKAENLDTLALYDQKDFKFVRYIFRVKEAPAFFSYWGSICKIDDDTFAGVYPSEYQIRIFNSNMEFKKNLLTEIPGHIKKYVPFNRSQSVVDQNAVNWTNTWSVMHSIYYVDGMFILSYIYNKESFLDIIDGEGKIVYPNYKEKKRFGIAFIEDNKYIWRLKVEEGDEVEKYTLVKQKLVLK